MRALIMKVIEMSIKDAIYFIFDYLIVGEELNFENLVYQLFEFILALKEKKKFKLALKKSIEELCYYTILYMQITDDQVSFSIKKLK